MVEISGPIGKKESWAEAYKQFDYFSDFARFDTATIFLARFFSQWNLCRELRVGLRSRTPSFEQRFGTWRLPLEIANAIQLFGIPDDAGQKDQQLFIGATFQQQTTRALAQPFALWSALRLRSQFTDYAPTGIPYDSPIVGPEYIGAPVTIRGANGYTVQWSSDFSVRPALSESISNQHGSGFCLRSDGISN